FSGSGYTQVDPDKVDLLAYPNITNVHWNYTTLLPGDCLFLPAEYIHQVRSHIRSISVTMLFTVDPDGTFNPRFCDSMDLSAFTTLDKVRVHWTYNKGDKVIEMGYMNIEVLRQSLMSALVHFNTKSLTEDHFAAYWRETDGQPHADPRHLFRSLLDTKHKGYITHEDILELPQQVLKDFARSFDPPHGP
ncbi:predicted protein, partial [Nematostella vectensis]